MIARRGGLIVLEGLDHSGKTTQAKLLVSALAKRGANVVPEPWRFPDRTTQIGKMISSYLTNDADMDDRALHLLFSANRWEKVDRLLQLIDGGTTVIMDRYAYSGVSYTAAKGIDLSWCKQCDRGLPAPDAVLFVSLPLKLAASRGTFGSEKYETIGMQEQVLKVFEELSTAENWYQIDGSGNVDEVHEKCIKVVDDVLGKIRDKPLGKLWQDEPHC
eukprot:CAMPEP_0113957344 /NCGR_PEP_ID=MMETSP0011_2-20120614/2718_1 /TAXON_ID=101924 /ORGANISM="Rhodosorus marinus" /LENGTH=216 /DNA_ID=CAMNT_0000967897 /DNA_START=76 /DNA_END=726 /DNA_ORIENTATION=+ /assembly_acc=CAM_ASM_000156